MCRITVCTATNIEKTVIAHVINDIMMRGDADKNDDGWGIHFGQTVYKSAAPYYKHRSEWIQSFLSEPQSGIVLGHVRAASSGTARTVHEAHPFMFQDEDANVLFVGAHNGFISNTLKGHTVIKGEPSSDSYRAFCKLYNILMDEYPSRITARHVQEWFENYEDDSAFAIAIVYKESLYLFRNSKRTLYGMTFGNGYLINTSNTLLEASKAYIQAMFNIPCGDVFGIDQDMLLQLDAGTHEFVAEEMNLTLVPSRKPTWQSGNYMYGGTYTSYGRYGSGTATTTENTKSQQNAKNPSQSKETNEEKQEKSTAMVVANTADETANALFEQDGAQTNGGTFKFYRNHICQSIAQELAPLSDDMVSLYAVLFSYPDIARQYDFNSDSLFDADWDRLSIIQLELFLKYVREHPLTDDQQELIRVWNELVEPDVQIDKQLFNFGTQMFFTIHHDTMLEILSEMDTCRPVIEFYQA